MKMRHVLTIIAALALGGCEAATGALASMGIQAITVAGQGVTRNIERDIDAGLRWAGAHDAYVAIYMQTCMEKAGDIEKWQEADAAFNKCLTVHIDNMPYTLAGRIAKRVERIKEPATVAEEPEPEPLAPAP